MPDIDFDLRRITLTILYEGPGTGPCDNLRYIHKYLPLSSKGRWRARKTNVSLSFSVGEVQGWETIVRLCSLPRGDSHHLSHILILKDVDGLVFVAEANTRCIEATRDYFFELRMALYRIGRDPNTIPLVLQVSGSETPDALSVDDVAASFSFGPSIRAVHRSQPARGIGVWETLKAVTKEVLVELTKTA